MANDVVQVAPDGAGKKIDNESLTVGANTVYRQRAQISGASATEIARVKSTTPGSADHGLVTRDAGPLSAIPGGWAGQPGSPVFFDPVVDAVVDTARWTSTTVGAGSTVTSGQGGTPALVHGFDLNVTTSFPASAQLKSVPTFQPRGAAPMAFHHEVNVQAVGTNGEVFWGLGDSGDGRGAFFRHTATTFDVYVLARGGTLEYSVSLTPLTIGAGDLTSKVSTEIHYAHDRLEFFRDGVSVGSFRLSGGTGSIAWVPNILMRVNNTAASVGNTTARFYQPSVVDYGRSNQTISDATYPWRQAKVSANNALKIALFDANDTAIEQAFDGGTLSGSRNKIPVVGATSKTSAPSLADNGIHPLYLDLAGNLRVNINKQAAVASDTVGATASGPKTTLCTTVADTIVVAAQGASLSIVVTGIVLSNRDAAKRRITLKDGATARLTFTAAADGGGLVSDLSRPWKLTANTAMNVALDVAGNVDVTVHYYVEA